MQFSFAFSGKLHCVSISSGNRPRCTKCVSILSSKDSEHCSIEAFTSRWQLIHYIRFVFVCQELFQNFFRSFWSNSLKNSNFSDRCLFRNSLFSISNSKPFVKNFFHSFQIFSVRPPCLSATALIEYHRGSPPVNNFFSFFCDFLWPCCFLLWLL